MDEKSAPSASDTPVVVDSVHYSGVDQVYQVKARILNRAIQDIGMGKYQVRYSFLDESGFLNSELFSYLVASLCRCGIWMVCVCHS